MAITQDGRLLNITTPLGPDHLLLERFTAREAISELFHITAELLHEEESADLVPHVVDPTRILGQPVTIRIKTDDGTKRELSGMVSRFAQHNRDRRFTYYNIEIVPHVWLLTQKSQSRIFQQKSVPDILKTVFTGFQTKYELQGTFEPRNYCVQYRETDFAFASRLMEEEGIFYFFEHSEGKHTMVFANTAQSNTECPSKSTAAFSIHPEGPTEFVGAIASFATEYRIQTGKVTLWDHNFQLPTNDLSHEKPSRYSYGDNQKLEMYDFPGGYARKFDGIDKAGGEQGGELQKIFADRQHTVTTMMEGLDSRTIVAEASSDVCSITPGYRFTLSNHPVSDTNGAYVITRVEHSAGQNPGYETEAGGGYTNRFSCIRSGAGMPTFRPEMKTPKPVVRGGQTAVVVGPAGEEIFTDKYGRVKVQFYWDREGQGNESSSCWIRVAQTWAGKRWGTMFIPRIGMEVVVDFLEGDPDQPIITGCVYNPDTMPPYVLPDEKTKSTIKTDSSKGGGGFNELRFEDKKGSEQVFIHAEKDKDIRVKNDLKEIVKHDRHLIVENEQFELVKKDKHLQVVGDHNEKIDGTFSLKVGADQQNKVASNYALESGMGVHIKAGMSAVIEAGTAITLKVGGSSININSGGIQIVGSPMLMLNSGGSPMSGAGCNPEAPKDAKEADTADPGQRTPAPQRKAPLAPASFGQLAAMMRSAARNGTPFCDI